MGGCSTPISALAEIHESEVVFKGNVLSLDGKEKVEVNEKAEVLESFDLGEKAGRIALSKGANKIVEAIHAAK